MARRKFKFVVEVDVDDRAAESSIRKYVDDAVASWCGQLAPPGVIEDYDPGDPLFDLKVLSVRNDARVRAAQARATL